MNAKVSVIMPVLNGERYLPEALESLAAQTYTNFELVAVDDGSTDRTRELLDQYKDRINVRYVNHPTCLGISRSMNDGLRNSTGKYVTFLDHDDVYFPHHLATQVAYMESHPEVGLVHADFQTIDSDSRVMEESVAVCRQRTRPCGWVFRELFMDSFIAAGTSLIRKECFDRLGEFDESLYWVDYHMWLRIARHYKIDYVPDVLLKYRQHSSQSTRTDSEQDRELIAVTAIQKFLDQYPEVRGELGERTITQRIAAMYFGTAYYWWTLGKGAKTRVYLKKAMQLWRANPDYYIFYALSLLPPAVARVLQMGWHRLRGLVSARPSAPPCLDRVAR